MRKPSATAPGTPLAEAMNLVEPGADGALAPADELSRGEAAEIVWRFVNR